MRKPKYPLAEFGERKGRLTVVEISSRVRKNGTQESCYTVVCDCGGSEPYTVSTSYFRNAADNVGCQSCSSQRRTRHPRPEIGAVFGHLTVVAHHPDKTSEVLVQCDCGSEPYFLSNFRLLLGPSPRGGARYQTRRCRGCILRPVWLPDSVSQEQFRKLRYRVNGALSRCHSPNSPAYTHYGARGISVWPQWRESPHEFILYLLQLPGWDDPDLDMDRTDVNRGYEPGNIRFVTRSQNVRNRRKVADLEARIRDLESQLLSSRAPEFA